MNLFKLRAMFQRVQQLLLPGPAAQSKSSKTSKKAKACWDRRVYIRRGEVERWVVGQRHRTHLRRELSLLLPPSSSSSSSSSFLSATRIFFYTLFDTMYLHSVQFLLKQRNETKRNETKRHDTTRCDVTPLLRSPPVEITCTKNYYQQGSK